MPISSNTIKLRRAYCEVDRKVREIQQWLTSSLSIEELSIFGSATIPNSNKVANGWFCSTFSRRRALLRESPFPLWSILPRIFCVSVPNLSARQKRRNERPMLPSGEWPHARLMWMRALTRQVVKAIRTIIGITKLW